jgi:hypothetical protein
MQIFSFIFILLLIKDFILFFAIFIKEVYLTEFLFNNKKFHYFII